MAKHLIKHSTKYSARNILIALCSAIIFLSLQTHFAISSDIDTNQNIDKTLSQLETRFFEHQYDNDSDTDRIDRIEQFIFGCKQIGSSASRLAHIQSAMPDVITEKINNAPNNTTIESTNNNAGHNEELDTSAGTESLDRNDQSIDQSADQSTNSGSSNSQQYSSYPHITSLEQELLGHTYETDAVPIRLARLETKAFGSGSSSDDLSERVDNLDDYAQRHDLYRERKIANNTNNTLAFVPSRSTRQAYNTQSVYPANIPISDTDESKQAKQSYTSTTGSFIGSMEERVAMMEAQEFDHTYPDKPLDKRLKKLEKKVLPNQDNSQLGLFQRTSKLWITLHPSDKNQLDSLIASNKSTTDGTFNSSENSNTNMSGTNTNNPDNTNNTSTTKHGSWLHRLANEIEATAQAPYSGYSNFSGSGNSSFGGYPYPGSFYVPQTTNYPNSRFIGGSFGPGAGPGGIPVGFW